MLAKQPYHALRMNSGDTIARSLRRSWKPSFRALGFPIAVRPGFFVFLALALVAFRGPIGPWLAGSIAVLTITHELGHAAVARLYGARAEIALDMFAGYTAYEPSRELSARERAMIALAGPVAEILPGVLALIAMGINPLDRDAIGSSDMALAIWLAGPVLGVVNLLPVLPLDGGVVVSTVAESISPARGRRTMTWISVIVTASTTVGLLVRPELRPMAVFTAALLAFQLMLIRAEIHPGEQAAPPSPGWMAIKRLLDAGENAKAGQYGASLFRQGGHADVALLVARAATRLGELTTAMAWLQSAAIASDDSSEVLELLEHHPDFAALREHRAFGALYLVLTS